MNDSSSSANFSMYYDLHYQIAAITAFGIPSVVGIVGNLMVVAVVLTVRGMMSPTNCYLVSLAVADCLFFLSSTPREISAMLLPKKVYVFGSVGCSILTFLPYLSMNSSSLSIAAFTIERYIGICHPIKAQYICTTKRAKFIIVAVWTFSLIYNSWWFFLAKLKPLDYLPGHYECTFSMERRQYKYVFFADFFLFYLIPLLLYFGLYGKMACILFRANFADDHVKINRKYMKHGSNDALNVDNSVTPSPTLFSTNNKRQSYQTNTKAIGSSVNKSRLQVKNITVFMRFCCFCRQSDLDS